MRWPRGPFEGEEHHRGTRETIWRSTTRNRRKQGRQERYKTRTLDAGTPSLNDEARASSQARDSHKPTRASPRVQGFTAIAVTCQTNSKNTGRKSSGLVVMVSLMIPAKRTHMAYSLKPSRCLVMALKSDSLRKSNGNRKTGICWVDCG